MPCYILKAKRLGLGLPTDEPFERELMKSLGVDSHEGLAQVVDAMPDSALIALIRRLLERRRKAALKYLEEQSGKEEKAYIA